MELDVLEKLPPLLLTTTVVLELPTTLALAVSFDKIGYPQSYCALKVTVALPTLKWFLQAVFVIGPTDVQTCLCTP